MPGKSTDTEALLERCPHCVYPLAGLPVVHRCPECGEAFDRRWQVFGGRVMRFSPRSRRWTIIPAMVVVLSMAALQLGMAAYMTGSMLLLIVPGVVIGLSVIVAQRRPRYFVAVGPEGVVVYRGRMPMERYEWLRVGKAEHDWLRKSLVLKIDGQPLRLPVFRFFGLSPYVADACAAAINKFLDR